MSERGQLTMEPYWPAVALVQVLVLLMLLHTLWTESSLFRTGVQEMERYLLSGFVFLFFLSFVIAALSSVFAIYLRGGGHDVGA